MATGMGLSSFGLHLRMTPIPNSRNPAGRIHEADATYCTLAAAKPDHQKHRDAGAQRGTE